MMLLAVFIIIINFYISYFFAEHFVTNYESFDWYSESNILQYKILNFTNYNIFELFLVGCLSLIFM